MRGTAGRKYLLLIEGGPDAVVLISGCIHISLIFRFLPAIRIRVGRRLKLERDGVLSVILVDTKLYQWMGTIVLIGLEAVSDIGQVTRLAMDVNPCTE